MRAVLLRCIEAYLSQDDRRMVRREPLNGRHLCASFVGLGFCMDLECFCSPADQEEESEGSSL